MKEFLKTLEKNEEYVFLATGVFSFLVSVLLTQLQVTLKTHHIGPLPFSTENTILFSWGLMLIGYSIQLMIRLLRTR